MRSVRLERVEGGTRQLNASSYASSARSKSKARRCVERDLEEGVPREPLLAQAPEELPRLLVMAERLLVGIERACRVTGLEQVGDGLLGQVGLAEVAGQQRESILAGLGPRTSSASPTRAWSFRRFASSRPEYATSWTRPCWKLYSVGRAPARLDDQIEPLELGERRYQPVVGDDLLEQLQREHPADHRGDADHLPGVVVEPVEPRLERPLDERRHGQAIGIDRQHPRSRCAG